MHLLAFFDFLPKRLMFPQILRSTQLDMPCLQKSRKKKTRYDCLFLKKRLQGTCADVFTRLTLANIVAVPCKWAQHCCAMLRLSQNNRNVWTCCAKSLTGFKLYATSANKCQHCCGSMQTDATSHNIVGPSNVACCWPTVLRPFAWAFRTQSVC